MDATRDAVGGVTEQEYRTRLAAAATTSSSSRPEA
jgi:hypothetical protein